MQILPGNSYGKIEPRDKLIRFSLVREGRKALSDIFEAERFCDIHEEYYDFRAFVIFFWFGIVRVIRNDSKSASKTDIR